MATVKKKPESKAQRLGPARPMKAMKPGQLFVSFWDMCLHNVPVGGFTHRVIGLRDARKLIGQARQNDRLLCVSNDYLFAPYHKRERKNHEELCAVLSRQCGISLEFADFTSKHERDGDVCYSAIPLECVQVHGDNRLLVVTCAFTWETRPRSKPLTFKIDPASVEFHLIEAGKRSRGK